MATKSNEDKLLLVLFFTLILSVMNATMFNVALPEIRQEFHLTSAAVGWVLSGYIVVYAIGTVTYGKLADQFSAKRIMAFGLIVLALGSLFGLFAQHFWMVIVGRILQSIGASVIPALVYLIPVRYFPAERRGRALGMVSTGLATGTAIGPIVAGLIASQLDWRYLFLLPVLLLGTIPFYNKYLTDVELKPAKLDWLGGSLLALTIVAMMLSITYGNLLLFVAGLLLLGILILQIRRTDNPFIAKTLLTNHRYVFSLIVSFLSVGFIFVIPFTVPMLLHDTQGLQAGQIGLVLAPGAIVAAFLGRRIGRLVDDKGNVLVYTIASLTMIGAFLLLAMLVGASPVVLAAILILTNVAQVGVQIAMSNNISTTLPRESAGLGMGMFGMMNFIAGAVSTTLIGKIIALSDELLTYHFIFMGLAIILAVLLTVFRLGTARMKG